METKQSMGFPALRRSRLCLAHTLNPRHPDRAIPFKTAVIPKARSFCRVLFSAEIGRRDLHLVLTDDLPLKSRAANHFYLLL